MVEVVVKRLLQAPLTRKVARASLRTMLWCFTPDAFLKQLSTLFVLIVLRRIFYRLRLVRRKITRSVQALVSQNTSRANALRSARRGAEDYASFHSVNAQLDQVEGLTAWKQDDRSPHYDARLLRARIKKYTAMREAGDLNGCMFALRSELLRKHFGTCNPELFGVCHTGTKEIVEQYIQTVCETLRWTAFAHRRDSWVAHDVGLAAEAALNLTEKIAFFTETKHSFGRTALLLSGGAAFGIYHVGVVKALHQNDLLPRIVSGTSAGSIICGIIAVRTDEELKKIWAIDFDWDAHFNFDFFSKPNFGRFVRNRGRGLYSAAHLGQVLQQNFGDLTFLEAFNISGRICNITVSGLPGSTNYPMLLNYLTSPNVLIWSACVASCAVPGIFEPVQLLAKDRNGKTAPYMSDGLKWQDGSMQSDLPMTRLAELFNVNYFLVSQVNPQSRLFSGEGMGSAAGPIYKLAQFCRRQVKQFLMSLDELHVFGTGWLNTMVSLVVQEYCGDITIFNGPGMAGFNELLTNATSAKMKRIVKEAEWETFWFIPQIKCACAIEFAMEEITQELKRELVAGSSSNLAALGPAIPKRMPSGAQLVLDSDQEFRQQKALSSRAGLGLRRGGATMASSQSLLDLLTVANG